MSLGHSNVTHYKNPGIKTMDVEEFIRAAKAAGTVETIECAKEYQGEEKVKAKTQKKANMAPGDDPGNPVWVAGEFYVDTF